jgi:hypothetical protein
MLSKINIDGIVWFMWMIIEQSDSKYCVRCGTNNDSSHLRCHKCYSILTMIMSMEPRCWIYVQLLPTGIQCDQCKIIGKRYWYTIGTKNTNDIVLRLCGECLTSVMGKEILC